MGRVVRVLGFHGATGVRIPLRANALVVIALAATPRPFAAALAILVPVASHDGPGGRYRLSQVDLEAFASRTIRERSLGQRRRVLLAAALIGEPPVTILDEPLDAMDARGPAIIIDWLDQKRRDDATIIVVSHEVEPFAELIDATFVVDPGSVGSVACVPS